MNQIEAQGLCKQMKAAWPNIYRADDKERYQLLLGELMRYPYAQAAKVIDGLIGELKNYPSISELRQALRTIAVIEIPSMLKDCIYCENTGWVTIDPEGHGTVKKCTCGHPYRREQTDMSSDRTSEGYPVATREEKRAAIIRGYRKYKPDATEMEVRVHLKRFGIVDDDPIDVGEVLIGAPITDDEPF